MPKSFRDYYAEDKVAPVRENYGLPDVQVEIPMPPVKPPKPEIVPEPVLTEDAMSSVKELITEQREESKKLLTAANKTNKKIVESMAILVEATNETNTKLMEAIAALTESVAVLEGKMDEFKNLEIPTPIVNLQMPSKKTIKNVHRDKRGMITHIEESEVFDEDDAE